MDSHVNGPAISPHGELTPGAYYFYNTQRSDVVPLKLVDIGDQLWISLPGNRLRFTGWVVVSNEEVAAGAELAIEPGTAAPVFANGKQWMVFVRAPGDAFVLEMVDAAS